MKEAKIEEAPETRFPFSPEEIKICQDPDSGRSLSSLAPVFATRISNIPEERREQVLQAVSQIRSQFSVQAAFSFISQLQVILGFRRPSLGIYDHAFHLIGGAQKYGCTIAHALQSDWDVTMISNKPVSIPTLEKWYGLNLEGCKAKTVPISFFEKREYNREYIEPGVIDLKEDNPFHVISRESGGFDFFINNSMLEMVYPMSAVSIFVCHFPERERSRFFYVDKYTKIICNSEYTAQWINNKWGLSPHIHLYPPVDMEGSGIKKENIILSVSRFDPGGNKQQREIIRIFRRLKNRFEESRNGWRLILAGGSAKDNPYLERIKKDLTRQSSPDIELHVNIPVEKLKLLYQKAKIFWHLTGLNQTDPAKVEHFGMTIVEAMQNRCVPLVYNGGGQREIVEEGISGYLFLKEAELENKTSSLIQDSELWAKLSRGAFDRSRLFSKEVFIEKIRTLFSKYLNDFTMGEISGG